MKTASSCTWLQAPGTSIPDEAIGVPRARLLLSLLQKPDVPYVTLIGCRRQAEPPADIIEIEVEVQKPQQTVHDIRLRERIGIIFSDDDAVYPEVLALRSDFPNVPHVNVRTTEFPRSLCLHDEPWESVRLAWRPTIFLQRIQMWLAKTAVGSLHAADQPLEPFLSTSPWRIVLPAAFDLAAMEANTSHFCLLKVDAGKSTTLRAVPPSVAGMKKVAALVFACLPQNHGVIRHQPTDLAQLSELLNQGGCDFIDQLGRHVRRLFVDEQRAKELTEHPIILVRLPKSRNTGGQVETEEVAAFLVGESLVQMGPLFGLEKVAGMKSLGILIGSPPIPSVDEIRKIKLMPLQVTWSINAETAARLSGSSPCAKKFVAIGVGALGSQVVNNLVRSGFGRWTLVDDDVILPHNAVRHFLGDFAIGHSKVEAMREAANSVLDTEMAESIACNILSPGDDSGSLHASLAEAVAIVDFSASVPVARHLANSGDLKHRCISVFIAPDGKSLAILAEDNDRKIKLDWLEMVYYRGVLNFSTLSALLAVNGNRHRYGNSCRDLSVILSQDDVATWSAFASRALKDIVTTEEANVQVKLTSDGFQSVNSVSLDVTVPMEIHVGDWRIMYDQWLIDKAAELRMQRLPNETGGVLLGCFDMQRHICYIVDLLGAPPDSKEWPTSYIRGCEGLNEQLLKVEQRTLHQIGYVGEWHSHPKGAAVSPSTDDLAAYAWLSDHMEMDSLPGLMLIVGDGGRTCFVNKSPQ